MKKRLLSVLLALCMVISLAPSVFAAETTVAKIGDTEFESFAEAMNAAKVMTGEVTVEIYGAVEFTDGMELQGSYSSIAFVGKSETAKITINQTAGGDYLEAHNKTVAFTDLILAKADPAWSGNSGHMGNYFSIQGGTVTYTNCTFPNGACTSTGTATYNNCTFQNTSEYGLWVYDDALVTVNGGTIDSAKGIKVYSEGEDSVTSSLTVQNATFTENVTKKPAVAIGYAESVTLIGNTYDNTTGELELDSGSDADCEGITFVALDAQGNDIADTLTAVDRSNSNAACGVLVTDADGTTKIYTTVSNATEEAESGDTVTLIHDSDETVELPAGVTLDKNDYTADNVTVAVPVATINGSTYTSLQAAIDEATKTPGSYEIVLASGTNDEDIVIHQTEGVNITIKGNGEDTILTGHIEVYGHGRNTGAETLTFDGVVFQTSEEGHVFIEQTCMTSTSESAEKCYPHNITVQNCSFTATGDAVNTAAGMKFRYGYNIKVTETTGSGLHSLMQNFAGQVLTIENVTITGGKNGIALGTSQNVSVTGLTVDAIGYGLRVDAQIDTTITVEDCDIEAFIPVVVRKAENNVDLVFNGDNTMTATNTDGIWCAIGTTEYETNGTMPTAPTGTVNVKLNDTKLDADGIYGEKELLPPDITYYIITFDVNGGNCAPETLTTDNDGKLSELPDATLTGYTFDGWYSGTEKVDSDTIYTQDTTLTAKWTANTYTVSLVTNGGAIRSGNVTEYTYGVGAVLPTNVTRSGYTFDGWYDNEVCKGSPVTEIKTTDIGNKTFYAKWSYIYIPIIPFNPTYPPVVDGGDNGSVVVTPAKPEKGDTVTITPDPDAGYEVDEVIVTDKNGDPVTVIDNGDGTYSFKQPSGKVTITATFKEIDTTCPGDWTCPMHDYTDLDKTAWYHDGIHFCIGNGLMGSTSTSKLTFEPDLTTSRAMIVTILWRLEGEPVANYAMDFEDVAADQWYTEAIRWAASEKIVEGYGNGKFGTNDAITREQFVTIMFRYAKYKGYDVSVGENTNILSYDDAFDVASWAIPAMQWACGESMIQGIADGSKMNLAPQGNATRAQAAAILQRFCANLENR